MATQAQMEYLAGLAIFDATFRDRILTNPQAAADSVGIRLTQEQVDQILALDKDSVNALAMLLAKEATLVDSKSPDGFWLARSSTGTSSIS